MKQTKLMGMDNLPSSNSNTSTVNGSLPFSLEYTDLKPWTMHATSKESTNANPD